MRAKPQRQGEGRTLANTSVSHRQRQDRPTVGALTEEDLAALVEVFTLLDRWDRALEQAGGDDE